MVDLQELGARAKAAAKRLVTASTEQKNDALSAMADLLNAEQEAVLNANAQDVKAGRAHGLSAPLIDRLTLTPERLAAIAYDTRNVIGLPDPVGEEFDAYSLPNGLQVRKRRTPLGVLGVIYESRPNVTIDVAALALKSGNAVILRGGSETLRSNQALVEIAQQGLRAAGLPPDSILFVGDPDRELVLGLLRLHDYVDMIIPRGGAALHKFCRDHATIPVITGGIGICHLYADETADLNRAVDVVENAKTQRPSVCNALDTLLVHETVADTLLPAVVRRLGIAGVTFRADESALPYLEDEARVEPARPGDWDTEWLSLVLGLKVVTSLDEAIEHIRDHSTGHSDGILTTYPVHADRFIAEVDSAVVYVNASTRFTDGGQLGLGGEVAVSTQRLHARGPMGLRELTTYKWIIVGQGHVRE